MTDTSQSYTFTFNTKSSLVGFASGRNNYVVVVTDENYSGDYSSPIPEGSENIEYMSVESSDNPSVMVDLPVFEGAVMYALGGSSSNTRKVCLPSILRYEDESAAFIIKVTSIMSHCVTADGAQYNKKNTWFTETNEPKITEIYIPETVTTVAANAFTGVPAEGVIIGYEGEAIPEGFDPNWTDCTNVKLGTYATKSQKEANVGNKFTDISERPNFILGCKKDEDHKDDGYDRPLVVEYNIVKENTAPRTVFVTLPIESANNHYDGIGDIAMPNASRILNCRLGEGESIDDESIVFHNIMKYHYSGDNRGIDTSTTYYMKPTIAFSDKQKLSNLLTFKASTNSTFAGFSMFTLKMDKNLSITSEKYPEPHSLYLDVKTTIYEQNKLSLQNGTAHIRYSISNLYKSSYHIVYQGKDGLKDITIPVSSVIDYQTLDKDKGNKVSIILENSKVAPDFSADKIRTFEMTNVTVQMDILSVNPEGNTGLLGKSDISYRFAYITVFENKEVSVFNWNLFLVLFFAGYVVVFAVLAFVLYKILKEKFKNDEFRRVNDKKFLKSAILYGIGFMIICAAIIFILMRVVGFANTIVAFNPTDPLLIVFSIFGMIIGGYFIVKAIKAIKVEKERRKTIRLKLNEDIEDDGTN